MVSLGSSNSSWTSPRPCLTSSRRSWRIFSSTSCLSSGPPSALRASSSSAAARSAWTIEAEGGRAASASGSTCWCVRCATACGRSQGGGREGQPGCPTSLGTGKRPRAPSRRRDGRTSLALFCSTSPAAHETKGEKESQPRSQLAVRFFSGSRASEAKGGQVPERDGSSRGAAGPGRASRARQSTHVPRSDQATQGRTEDIARLWLAVLGWVRGAGEGRGRRGRRRVDEGRATGTWSGGSLGCCARAGGGRAGRACLPRCRPRPLARRSRWRLAKIRRA